MNIKRHLKPPPSNGSKKLVGPGCEVFSTTSLPCFVPSLLVAPMKLAPTLPGSHPTRNVLHEIFRCSFFLRGWWVGGNKKTFHGWMEKMARIFWFYPSKFSDAKRKQHVDVISISKMEHMEEKNGRIFILSQQIPVATAFFRVCDGFLSSQFVWDLGVRFFTGSVMESGFFRGKVCATIWVKSRGNRCIFDFIPLGNGWWKSSSDFQAIHENPGHVTWQLCKKPGLYYLQVKTCAGDWYQIIKTNQVSILSSTLVLFWESLRIKQDELLEIIWHMFQHVLTQG